MVGLIDSLEISHRKLRQLFLMQQECLLLAEDEKAWQLMTVFADYLKAHLLFEEQHLFSLFSDSTKQVLRWQPLVYQKEHEKLLQLLAKNIAMLQSYSKLVGREKRLALLELLAKQNQFEHVLEHHEQREESDLFPALTELQTTEQLNQHWLAIEQDCLASHQIMIKQISQELAAN